MGKSGVSVLATIELLASEPHVPPAAVVPLRKALNPSQQLLHRRPLIQPLQPVLYVCHLEGFG